MIEKQVIFDTYTLVQSGALTSEEANIIRTKVVEQYFDESTTKQYTPKGCAWVTNSPKNLTELLMAIIPHGYVNGKKTDLSKYTFYTGNGLNVLIPDPFTDKNLSKMGEIFRSIRKAKPGIDKSWISGTSEDKYVIIEEIVKSDVPLMEWMFSSKHVEV